MRFAVLCVALIGCRQLFGIDSPTLASDGSTSIDAPIAIPDGGMCLAVSSECASADVLRVCLEAGAQSVDTTCAWGCVATNPHCGALEPSGGGVSGPDLTSTTGLDDVTLSGTIDDSTGTISGTTTRTAGVGVIAGIDFKVVNNIAVFRFASLHLETVTVTGPYAVAFVANGDITVDDVVDLLGPCVASPSIPGPGGFAGGQDNADAMGSGAGAGGGGSSQAGGGGGGYGGTGGNSGGFTSSTGGPSFGTAKLATLVGGGGGGAGGGPMAGFGGGGGGAIQLASNGAITIAGGINAGGCGGYGSMDPSGGGGGGAGGAILIEGPSVVISGSLAVNGGGGGAGDANGGDGSFGTLDRTAAAGGLGQNGSSADGAVGAAGNVPNGASTAAIHPGGGGGAIGRIRINTRTGNTTVDPSAVMSPDFGDTASTATEAAASVE